MARVALPPTLVRSVSTCPRELFAPLLPLSSLPLPGPLPGSEFALVCSAALSSLLSSLPSCPREVQAGQQPGSDGLGSGYLRGVARRGCPIQFASAGQGERLTA